MSLIEKISRFNPKRPYVWELKITENEFHSLEEDICKYTLDESKKDDALKILVYVSEWYKRRYTNKTKKDYQKTFGNQKPNLELVWTTLAIDERYLYKGENNQKLYLYSTFILSGLAVKFERQKNEKPFLRALCRVYNNEDESFDRIVDNNHSIAFKESISRGHCLRDFLEAIITAKENIDALPFAKDDYDNHDTEVRLLVELIREINYEVNKSKFRFEWIVTSIPGDNLLSRRLRIWLNPEEKGKLHQLLRNERLKKWGFEEPENMCYVRLGVRYWIGDNVIKEPNFHHPDIYYRNTGDASIGFICEKIDYADCYDVPIQSFDRVQLITWKEDGTVLPIPVQDETVDFYAMQLYRLETGEDVWTSRVNNQKETALLFSDKWIIADNSVDQLFERKIFYNRKSGEGDSVSWSYIHASITIENGEENRTYYNRQGYDHIVARLYNDTIGYTDEGKVLMYNTEDDDSPEIITPVFLIFGRHDIIAYHTETKDGEDDVCEETEIQLFEFKKNGNYFPWTETEVPDYGYVELRLTIKERKSLFKAFYLPKPIERDLNSNTIHYYINETEVVYDDKIDIQKAISKRQILKPTIVVNIGSSKCHVAVPVFRPIKLKEVCCENKILTYDVNGTVTIPYILKQYLNINIYGEKGYHSYICKHFKNVFHELNCSEYRIGGKYTSAIDGKIFTDQQAPEGVTFFVRKSFSKNPRLRYCYWDCNKDTHPIPISDIENFDLPNGCILFQDQRRFSHNIQCEYIEKEAKGFAKIKKKGEEDYDLVFNIFIVACAYNQYFFYFKALRTLANGVSEGKRDFFDEIYKPLLKFHNNILSMRDKKELLRFADEFCLDTLKEQLKTKFNNIV